MLPCFITAIFGSKAHVKYSAKPYVVKNSFGKHKHVPEHRYRLPRRSANGNASYYGTKFNGRKTSGCVIFDERQMTAAHPTAVIPSVARVTRVDNGKSIYVIITDRGPFAKGRICDLSVAAAKRLGYHRNGHIKVRIAILPVQSKILSAYWKKFLHKKLPNELFRYIHSPTNLALYLRRFR